MSGLSDDFLLLSGGSMPQKLFSLPRKELETQVIQDLASLLSIYKIIKQKKSHTKQKAREHY